MPGFLAIVTALRNVYFHYTTLMSISEVKTYCGLLHYMNFHLSYLKRMQRGKNRCLWIFLRSWAVFSYPRHGIKKQFPLPDNGVRNSWYSNIDYILFVKTFSIIYFCLF